MRVEIRTQKGVPLKIPGGETRTNTEYGVYLVSKKGEVRVAMFSTPGSFVDGFLSETQAKVRAREIKDNLTQFLQLQGDLDQVDDVPTAAKPRVSGSRRHKEPFREERSFMPRTA